MQQAQRVEIGFADWVQEIGEQGRHQGAEPRDAPGQGQK